MPEYTNAINYTTHYAINYAAVAVEEAALSGMAVAVHAARNPAQLAVIDQQGQALSWAVFNARVNQLAHYLRALGLGQGDAIAMLCSNRAEFPLVMMASYRTGTRVTPINWHLTGEEISYILDNSDARVLIAEHQFGNQAIEAIAMGRALQAYLAVGGDIAGFDALEAVTAGCSEENIAEPLLGSSMLYTSGTTGRPKGVYRQEHLPILPDVSEQGYAQSTAVVLCTGPAYHAAPLLIDVMIPLVSGATLVLMDKWTPEETLHLIEQHAVTHCHMVATMFHRLLQLDDDMKQQYGLSSLRRVMHGAAPCPVHIKQGMIDWFGPVLVEYYAATEGGGGFLIDSHDWLRKPGSVGCPGPEFDNKILNDEGREVPLGEVGTIYMHAPAVGRFCYYKDDAKTADSYRGDYFTLGDMGYFDEDGYLFLTGRSAELIISAGVNIYPQEVDNGLLEHVAVLDVCTVGVPNEEWGEEVKSVVQLHENQTPSANLAEELMLFAKTRIAPYKCPRSIDFVETLPRLATGKIQRRAVRGPYWESPQRFVYKEL